MPKNIVYMEHEPMESDENTPITYDELCKRIRSLGKHEVGGIYMMKNVELFAYRTGGFSFAESKLGFIHFGPVETDHERINAAIRRFATEAERIYENRTAGDKTWSGLLAEFTREVLS